MEVGEEKEKEKREEERKNKIKSKSGHGFWGEMLEEAKLNSFS